MPNGIETVPTVSPKAVDVGAQRLAAPDVRDLMTRFRESLTRFPMNPQQRRRLRRQALAGFGEGLASVLARSRQAALAEERARIEPLQRQFFLDRQKEPREEAVGGRRSMQDILRLVGGRGARRMEKPEPVIEAIPTRRIPRSEAATAFTPTTTQPSEPITTARRRFPGEGESQVITRTPFGTFTRTGTGPHTFGGRLDISPRGTPGGRTSPIPSEPSGTREQDIMKFLFA